MSLPSSDASTAARVRGLLADVIELAQVRFELFTVEAREELARLAGMAVMGALAVVFVSFGLIFLAIFLTVLLWDTHRVLFKQAANGARHTDHRAARQAEEATA